MANFCTTVETEVDIDLTPIEIFYGLNSDEKIELERLIKNGKFGNKNYSISDMVSGMMDSDILTNKVFLDYFIKLIKYETPDMLEYLKEELNY